MGITTRSGKKTIEPPMSSKEENLTKDNDKVVKVSVKKKIIVEKMLECIQR